jgi:Na+/H+ antiporter NhaD/arsenite permease-like protein
MTGTARIVVTLTVFATMLALVVVRPRRWNKAWWTMLGYRLGRSELAQQASP